MSRLDNNEPQGHHTTCGPANCAHYILMKLNSISQWSDLPYSIYLQCSKQREYILLFGTNLCITSKLHHLCLKKLI